ncbi:MAG: hypothetical protein FJ145_09075 [Deltaproteobacteria bacterium]|nr:hypothetical protein [Deltaproteobacteria bacterium]
MICAKPSDVLKGAICEPCQDRIRREAMGEQAGVNACAERELNKHGVMPSKEMNHDWKLK